MRKKIKGYILQFTRSDHAGKHIHVYKEDEELGEMLQRLRATGCRLEGSY